jgi:hypothetical protein
VVSGEFSLQAGDSTWAAVSTSGFEELRRLGRISASENEPGIRLCPPKAEDSKLTWRIQKARYWDQARSNLILDWTVPGQRPPQRLRDLLVAKYGSKLPDLNDRRMANTIGVACLIFFWEKGRLIPYLIRRVEKVGVFPGGLHTTASGAANWPKGLEKSFENFFTQAMYDELREEVGLVREDIADLKPMAFCREYLRGGKPQIFYAGFTRLTRSELRKKRIGAEKTIKKLNRWPEVDQKSWMDSDDVIIPPEKLEADIGELGVSLECRAAYYYAREYLKKDSQALL